MSDKFGVSGLLPLNKIDNYTRLAIDSMLNQSRPLDELVIVINGSQRKKIKATLAQWYGDIYSVKLITCEIEQLAYALNTGMANCEYQYIARMDADDISHEYRIEKQLNYIVSNKLDMVGCNINKIDSTNKIIGSNIYPRGNRIKKALPFTNPFCHPAVMFKRNSIIESRGYNAGFKSEDYDLWLRLSRSAIRWDNMDEILFSYRIHNSTAQRKSEAYAELAALMIREMLINKSVIFLFAFIVSIFKFLIRGKR